MHTVDKMWKVNVLYLFNSLLVIVDHSKHFTLQVFRHSSIHTHWWHDYPAICSSGASHIHLGLSVLLQTAESGIEPGTFPSLDDRSTI